VFRTTPIALESFEESYTCFAVTVDEDTVVDGFTKSAQKFVHHAQFVIALLPEPDGISTCNEQFKLTWMPIFLAGNGASELRFDEGVGHVLPAGAQLVLQMHLFNTSDRAAQQAVEIRMHKSTAKNPTPVSPWAIGSSRFKIPARQAGRAQNVCTQNGPVEVLAVFPHMHQLGQKMTVEVGSSLTAMRLLYARDPFSFDDQHMENMKFKLAAGDKLRVTCDFKMNTSDDEVGFGESSEDEMCFFVGFALGEAPEQADCPNLWDALLWL
jgi:copper type II ascorbate-dependent monooxygenase-like protein